MFSSTFNIQSLFTKSRRALLLHIELLGKKEEYRNVLFFFIFSWKVGFDISCKLYPSETICMKYQVLFYGKNKKKISLSSAESADSMVSNNSQMPVRKKKKSATKLCFS